MKKYDILVVGASTTGSWFAREMAKLGHSVLVIEKQEAKNVSRDYDIFHMAEHEMKKFGLDIPEENSKEYGFTFESSAVFSPFGTYAKKSGEKTVGMHKHEYIMYMNKQAKEAGAKIVYGASFKDFITDEKGKRVGAKYETKKGEEEVYCKLVADCSGIPAVARTKLPDGAYVENFKLTPRDIFYVVLYYVKYAESVNARGLDGSFLQYKTWSAPSGDKHGAILGVGGNFGYDYAEEIFKQFMTNVPWPDYTVEKIEKGMTPYHRSLYSFVEDGFIAMGDTALLTKPTAGEGCTSSLYQAEIAVEVISKLLKEEKELSKENMWQINKRYIAVQGKDFDTLRPILIGVIKASLDEAEYLFAKDIIFSQKILGGMGELNFTPKEIAEMVAGIASGVIRGKLKASTVKEIVKGLLQSVELGTHYDKFPDTPEGYKEWKKQADEIWDKIGKMADVCDNAVLRRLGKV